MTTCDSLIMNIMSEPYAGKPHVRFDEEGGNPTLTLRYVDGLNLYRGYFVVGGMDPSGLENTEELEEGANEYIWLTKKESLDLDSVETTHGSGRGRTVYKKKISKAGCYCLDGESPKVFRLILVYKFNLTKEVLKAGHEKYKTRLKKYDQIKSPRTDDEERGFTIAHEDDHFRTFKDGFSEIKDKESEFQSKDYKNNSDCKKARDFLVAAINKLTAQVKAHSARFDSNYQLSLGNQYSSDSFTKSLDLTKFKTVPTAN